MHGELRPGSRPRERGRGSIVHDPVVGREQGEGGQRDVREAGRQVEALERREQAVDAFEPCQRQLRSGARRAARVAASARR